jgi:Domain of unknown function (DUF4129)
MKSNPQSAIRNPQSALLPVCFAGMDACWIFAVAWLFSQVVLSDVTDFPVPPVFMLVALELGGWAVMTYLLDRTALPIGLIRSMMAGVGLVLSAAIAFALSPYNPATFSIIWVFVQFFAGFISLGLWMVGGYRATERANYEDIYSTFRLGLVAMSVAALLSTVLANKQINQLWTELGGVGLWFFVFGLGGLALGNREAVRLETGNVGMKSWGWMVVGSVAGILLFGSLGQGFGGKDVLTTLQDGVLTILAVIAFIFYGLFYLLLWPLSLLNIQLGPIGSSPLPTPTPAPTNAQNPLDQLQKTHIAVGSFQIPAELQSAFMTLAAGLVVAAVAYFMAQWLRRTGANRTQVEDEERVNFGSWRLLLAQLRAWLLRLLVRFRKPAPAVVTAEEDDLAALQGHLELAGTLSVRQIYAHLLKLAASAGYPRASYQTPIEYLRFLSTALPDLRSDLNDITGAYLEARYAPLPTSLLSVQTASAAWRRAEPALVEESAKRKT